MGKQERWTTIYSDRPPATKPVPEWAQMLICGVCESWNVPQPVIRWSTKNRRLSTGRAWSHEISRGRKLQIGIVQGTDHEDTKMVLLHELAHYVLPEHEHHGSYFWHVAFEMYRDYDINLAYAAEREGNYRKEARYAAARLRG